MTMGRLHHQSGIALGPILFIIAIIAILAGVIAAGSGGFNANTGTESDKAMAQSLVTLCDDYRHAAQMLYMNNSCSLYALDFTPPGYPPNSTWNSGDFTAGNGTNRAGNGQCAFFDPRGGGLTFKQVPIAALASPASGAYTAAGSSFATNADAFAGYPQFLTTNCFSAYGRNGQCAPTPPPNAASLYLGINYISPAVCQQIDQILATPWSSTSITIELSYHEAAYSGYNMQGSGGNISGGTDHTNGQSEGCAHDIYSNGQNSAFVFMCMLIQQ